MTTHESLYRWSFRAPEGMSVEVEVRAESAIAARRRVTGFLAQHDGIAWQIESVSREAHLAGAVEVLPHVLSEPAGRREGRSL